MLKRRRDRERAIEGQATTSMEVMVQRPELLDQPLSRAEVDFDVVASHDQQLRELRAGLADYAEGLADVDATDVRLLKQVASLRALLELAYGQHLTFQGESRPATGTPLSSDAAPQDSRRQVQINADRIQGQQVGDHNTQTITFGQ